MAFLMMKKYLLCLFFTILLASGSLWACAESLMMDKQQLDERTLRELASNSRYMLSRASLIAYVSGSQTVNTKHILLAALTRVESSNEKLNYLNDTDIIDDTPTFNALGLILKELKILREVQEFLLSQLDIQVRDSLSFELNYNDLLILHLRDISSVPNLMYDESAIAFFERAVQEKEEEIRYMRNNSDNKTFFIPIFPEHFFLAAFSVDTGSVDTGMSHFLSELLNKPPIKIKEDLFHKIEQARQTLLSISKRSYYLQSQEEKEIITLKLETLFTDYPGGLTFEQIKAGIPEFDNISDGTIKNRLKENGYEVQGRGRGALWHQQGHQTKKDEEKTIISRKLESLFADHPEGLTFEQIKDAEISEFDNISDWTIRRRLKENRYEAQGLGPGALWNHQQGYQTRQDKEKEIITRKLEALFTDYPGGLTFKQIKAKIPEFANISDPIIRNRLQENGYEAQGRGRGALWHQQGHQTKKDEEKAIITLKLEALFANHPKGLTLKQIKAGIPEFANISDGIIRRRLKENRYEAQGRGAGALWNHQQSHQTRQDEEKPIITRKLEALFTDYPGGLTFKQIKAKIPEFDNKSDDTIRRRLKENGYEAQGRGPWALWNHQQGHQTKKDEEKTIITRKLESLFADHPKGLTLKQIKAGITEFDNISDKTIRRRLKENRYEAQGLGPYALWHQQGHQTKQDEKAIITHKLESLFADHPGGLTFKQIKAEIPEFANILDKTIRRRLKENGYEVQGHGRGALWKKRK